jgi:hypothetical protein
MRFITGKLSCEMVTLQTTIVTELHFICVLAFLTVHILMVPQVRRQQKTHN